ncbi:MAG: hypothetical protein ABIV50_08905 [Opitutus sp.]
MQVLEALKQAVKACAEVIGWGSGIQEPQRKDLAMSLQAICTACDTAYGAVLARLVPIKNAFGDPAALATEIRSFAADSVTRDMFKPEHLCGQVDQLLVRLSSNLDSLKYSIDFRRINELRQYLGRFGDYDGAIFESYDDLVAQLDKIASEIQLSAKDKTERADYARRIIQRFEKELRETQTAVRDAKKEVIALI